MEALVKSCNICWVWLGRPGHAQSFHVVTRPCKLQCYHVVLVGYGANISG